MDTNTPFIITISRSYGSTGRTIGQNIAEHLGINYYDKVIFSQAAEDTGLGPRVFHHPEPAANEHHGFFHQVIGAVQPFLGGGDFFSNNQLSDEDVFSLQSGVITRLATEKSCVIVGRAADHILRNHPHRISIFITANLNDRIQQVMDEKHLDRKAAIKLIKQNDSQRANYYNFHSDKTWSDAENYDLCINVSTLGRERTIQFILNFIKEKFQIPTETASSQVVPELY